MRSVIYADDMEPITVIDLPGEAAQFFRHGCVYRVSVDPEPECSYFDPSIGIEPEPLRIVTIRAELLVRGGIRHWMLFTADEESALMLKAAFLPGQQRALQEREKDAFARGFVRSVQSIIR